MKCPFCGYEFEERDEYGVCKGCPMAIGSCNMIKCPRCGYEHPSESRLLKRLRRWRKRKWR